MLTVAHDNYPLETSWTLKDENGALIASQSEESFDVQGGTAARTVYLADGSYTFAISDSYGDGICCQYGNGNYQIAVNGETVKNGDGQFASSASEPFTVVSSTGGGGGSGGGAIEYRVDVQYDNYPLETRWLLQKRSDGTRLVEYGFDEIEEEGASLSESVNLVAGQEYILKLRDSYGDGFCCQYGAGSIAVYARAGGIDYELASSDGQFGRRENIRFLVPADIRSAAVIGNTQEAECSDSDDEEFHVDDKVGNRTCEWLSLNLDRFDYLCEFVDVAAVCPQTCDACFMLP